MTPRIALYLAWISLLFNGFTFGIAWSATLVNADYLLLRTGAVRICKINDGHYLRDIGGLPPEIRGWNCYRGEEWIGPHIMARRYLPYENKTGFELYEEEVGS